MVALKTAISRN